MRESKNLSKKSTSDEFSLQIIAGDLKGRVIHAPNLGVTRPPLSRLRRSIFDYLYPYLEGAKYLDLFSGTGSYLFEAASRGAKVAIGVELEVILAESINSHAKKFGVSEQVRCLQQDVFAAIPKLGRKAEQFDIIMVAPPQYKGLIDRTLRVLQEQCLLADQGQIICQHDTSESKKIQFAQFEIAQQRKYGNTTFTILHNKPN